MIGRRDTALGHSICWKFLGCPTGNGYMIQSSGERSKAEDEHLESSRISVAAEAIKENEMG